MGAFATGLIWLLAVIPAQSASVNDAPPALNRMLAGREAIRTADFSWTVTYPASQDRPAREYRRQSFFVNGDIAFFNLGDAEGITGRTTNGVLHWSPA